MKTLTLLDLFKLFYENAIIFEKGIESIKIVTSMLVLTIFTPIGIQLD